MLRAAGQFARPLGELVIRLSAGDHTDSLPSGHATRDHRPVQHDTGEKIMKIRVTVEIDLPEPEQWTTAFGIKGRDNIRKDVKSYVGNVVQQTGVFGNGEVDSEITWS